MNFNKLCNKIFVIIFFTSTYILSIAAVVELSKTNVALAIGVTMLIIVNMLTLLYANVLYDGG